MAELPIDCISDSTPVPLAQACKLFFPAGGVTVSSLRREAARGRLVIERIANRDFVTREAVDKMREACRIIRDPPPPGQPQTRSTTAGPRDLRARSEEFRKRLKAPMPGAKRAKAGRGEGAKIEAFPGKSRPVD